MIWDLFKRKPAINDKSINDVGALRTFVGNIAEKQNKKDVITNSQYTYEDRILEQYLENAYQQSWFAKRIVEVPGELAMLNNFVINLKRKEDEKRFWDKWQELELTDLVLDTQKWADVYGSCILFFKNGKQDPIKPYTNYKDLEFIQVQYPFYTPLPKIGNVYETDRVLFNLMGITADLNNMAVFHGTKCVKRLAQQFKYFGMSIYQNIWRAMISDDLITTAVANMIYRSSTPVYKLDGFKALIGSGRQDLVLKALETAEASRGIFGALTLDKNDDFLMVNQSITALADLDRRSAERVCGSVGYPATFILGKSPDGMNSTGKHDEKNLVLAIQRYQNKMLKPIKQIAYALMDHLEIDRIDCKIYFNNPYSQDREEKARTDNMEIQNALNLQQAVQDPKIMYRYLRENNLITEEEYDNLVALSEEMNEVDTFEEENEQIQGNSNTETAGE